ncbi:MAG: M23 family metallopeptidase [Candidatus Cryptobacteroides sp.]|nr:M23 family metallopeptidase [Bacteroidales bacterium]MDY3963204.1 M23 family metallopeptidase [Candidatus Cryptobacteroides sp.]
MSEFKRYKLNPETLLYEIEKVSAKSRAVKIVMLVAASIALSSVYFWLATDVFGLELPKTVLLKKTNARWISRMELMNRQMDIYDASLEGLGIRDDEIYRNIFGMNVIPDEVRNAGFGGVNRYEFLDVLPENSILRSTTVRLDVLTKKTYVQSRSYDEIEAMSKKAGDMASCIPAVPPIAPDKSKYRLSSPYGYRSDPITGVSKMHTGFDFACKPGNPVYATGDGTVESVSFEFFGYGNSVLIDHGFGYKTRYAHLKMVYVSEGMKLKRGECIGETGNSGRSTGPHLHYEVMYRGRYVNPYNYFDMTMPLDEYSSMVSKVADESENVISGRFRPYR